MEEDDNNPQQGGVGVVGVGIIYKIRGTVAVAIRLGELGVKPPYGKYPGEFQ